MAAGDVVNTAARLQAAAPVNGDPRRRADLPGDARRDRLPRGRAGRGEGQGGAGRRLGGARARARASAVDVARHADAPLVGRERELDAARRRARARRAAGARAAARHARRRARDRQEPARRRAVRGRRARPRARSPGGRAARSLRRRRRRSGRSARWSRRRRASSRPTAETRRARSSARPSTTRRRDAATRTGSSAPAPARRARRARPTGGERRARRSRPGAGSSRRSPSSGRSCSCSRICTGPTTPCSTSSTSSSTGRAASRCSSSAPPARAARAPAGLGRRQAERARRSALVAALRRRHRAADRARCSSGRACRPRRRRRCSRAPAATRSTRSSSRGCSSSAARPSELPLPETVQGIIAARLDGSPTSEKRLLQDAAVVGKVFWPAALAALDGLDAATLERALHALERKEFVRRERRSVGGGRERVRLPPRARPRRRLRPDPARGARRRSIVAPPSGSSRSGRPEDQAEMLAHHYARRSSSPRAAGRGQRGLVEPRAARAPRRRRPALGAERVRGRGRAYYGEALALWPGDDPERPRADLPPRPSPVPRNGRPSATGARGSPRRARRPATGGGGRGIGISSPASGGTAGRGGVIPHLAAGRGPCRRRRPSPARRVFSRTVRATA